MINSARCEFYVRSGFSKTYLHDGVDMKIYFIEQFNIQMKSDDTKFFFSP